MDRLLRKADAAQALGISVTTLWRLRGKDPHFPRARQITRGGVVGFLESEISAYLTSRPEADEASERGRVTRALEARGIDTSRLAQRDDASSESARPGGGSRAPETD